MNPSTRLAGVCIALLLSAASFAAPIQIVRDGKPVATIIVPDKADPWTKRAAGWLREYVRRSTGAALPILTESKAPKGALICVGKTDRAWRAGVDLTGLTYDGCRITARDGAVFLRGIDRPGPKEHPYYAPKGTCRAVVLFLERFVGVRWLVPTPEGDDVPERRNLSVPDGVDIRHTPAFVAVQNRAIYDPHQPWSFAQNFRVAVRMKSYGGHSFYNAVPAAKYGKTHPEYFALRKGKRDPTGNHLCTSNPDVKRMILEEVRRWFDRGYDWVQIGQTDGFKRCECAKCEALDTHHFDYYQPPPQYAGYREALKDHPCDRLHLLYRWVAQQCLKSHPGKMITMLTYGPTVIPPRKFHKYPPNVIAEIAGHAHVVQNAAAGGLPRRVVQAAVELGRPLNAADQDGFADGLA